jgi:hypothetical protein
MPRENVPHKVDEIADAIVYNMKKNKKKISKEKMYDIAYGTAWKQYYKKHPKKKASEILENLKIAQFFDDANLFSIADKIERIGFSGEK